MFYWEVLKMKYRHHLSLIGIISFVVTSCSTPSYVKSNQLLVAQGKGQISVENYQSYIKESPNDSRLYYYLAEIQYQLEDYTTALSNIKKAIILEEQIAKYRLLAGKVAFQSQNYFEAINYLTSTLVLNDNLLEAYYYLALSYEKTGKTSEAIEQLTAAISLEPLYFDARFEQIRITFEQNGDRNNFSDLIAELKDVLAIHPGSTKGILLLSRLYFTYGETYKARQVLENWLGQFPENDEILYALAELQLNSGLRDKAVLALKRISKPGQKSRMLKIKIDLSRGRSENLLKEIEDLRNTYGESSELFAIEGDIFLKIGSLNKAERALQKAVQIDSSNSKAYILLSKVWESQGDLLGAGRALESAYNSDPIDFSTRIYYLNKLVELGEIERAVEVFEKYELDSTNSDVLYLKAVIADYQGNYHTADQYLKRAQRESYSSRIEVQLARSEIRRGRLTAAESRLKRVLKLYPNYAEAIPVRGELFYRKNNFSGAIKYLTPHLNQKKFNGKVHLWLAEAYLQQGNMAKAADVLKAAFLIWPGQIDIIQNYTMVLGVLKKFQDAIKILEEAQLYSHKYKKLFHSRLIQYYYYTGQTKKLLQYQYRYRVTEQSQRFNRYLYQYILKEQSGKAENDTSKK